MINNIGPMVELVDTGGWMSLAGNVSSSIRVSGSNPARAISIISGVYK